MQSLILKRASASHPPGEWNDDDYDVLTDGGGVGRIFSRRRIGGRLALDVNARLRPSRGSNVNAGLRGDARGRDGGVHQELAAEVVPRSGGRSAFGGQTGH